MTTLARLVAAAALVALADTPATAQATSAVFGGSARETVFDVAVDAAGFVYLTGETYSADFPIAGGVQATRRGPADAFVIKLAPSLSSVVYSTYFGGSGFDSGRSIAVDAAGNAYVVGYTESADLPLQSPLDANRGGFSDAFILKLNPQGSATLFSTYFGGTSFDNADAVALDAAGRIYVAGRTGGSLPVLNAAQPTFGGGEDAFVARLNASLTTWEYITYLGGNFLDMATALDVDPAGRACIAGVTASTTFPVVSATQNSPGGGAQDAFVALLGATGADLLFASYVGGTGFDRARGVSCTSTRLAVVGETESSDFPTGATGNEAVQSILGGERDAFLATFDISQQVVTRIVATLLGGRRSDTLAGVVVEGDGTVRMGGATASSGLPEAASPAVGLRGAGVVRSTDAGVTWVDSDLKGVGINGLAKAASTPARWLAATDLGLHVSTDNGATWTRQTTGLPSRVVHDVVVSPTDACTWVIGIDAAAADGATPIGAARTTDCGASWAPWGFPALRLTSLAWLGDPTRLVVTADRVQPFDTGSEHDTCVTNELGAQVRCFGQGTSANVIAVDPSGPCRWFEGTSTGLVFGTSGNAFGCDHPFVHVNMGLTLGAPVTALRVIPTPTGPSVWAGLRDGKLMRAFPDAAPQVWVPTAIPVPYPSPVGAIAPGAGGVVTLTSGTRLVAMNTDGSSPAILSADTRASALGSLDTDGNTFVGGGHGLMRYFHWNRPTSLPAGVGISFLPGRASEEEPSAYAASGACEVVAGSGLEEPTISAGPHYYYWGGGGAFPGGGPADGVVRQVACASDPGNDITASRTHVPADGGVFTVRHTPPGTRLVGIDSGSAGFVKFLGARAAGAQEELVFSVEPHADPNPRQLSLRFQRLSGGTTEVTLGITQDGAAPICADEPGERELSVPAAGGEVTHTVTAPGNCTVTATTEEPWHWVSRISAFASSVSGMGSGTVTIEVAPNTGPGRMATVSIGGHSILLVQGAAPSAITDRSLLAEGATSTFFDTRIAVANPSPTASVVATTVFDTAQGQSFERSVLLPPASRATVDPSTIAGLAQAEFSTSIAADGPVVAARLMQWDGSGYGSHAEAALTAPSTTWYLAEGATHSGFELFYLLQNPGTTAANVEVRYLRPAPLPPLVRTYVVAARSRFNIWVNQEGPELAQTDVSAILTSTNGVPIAVERAMYLSSQGRVFNAGHDSAGIPAPATQWFLAEGATGPYLDLYVLVANPSAQDAPVTVRYLLTDGTVIEKMHLVAANSRFTIWVDGEDAQLADVALSTTVTSTAGVPIVVERALWWPGSFATWHEGHNSAGATQTGTRWAVAEGEVGGAAATETYILVANVSPQAGEARVTLLFEDAPSASRTFTLPPTSRTNVAIAAEFPEATGRRFGVLVESLGTSPAQLVVEAAIYGNSSGVTWAAGANLLATRL